MPLRLETFALSPEELAPPPPSAPTAEEEARLTGYDDGYSAGWDDALAARDDDAARLREAVGQNLQTLNFTWHEARAHVLQSLRPLLEAMVTRLLPTLSAQAMPAMVADAMMALAAESADTPITLRLNPASRSAVEGFLTSPGALPVTVVEDAALPPGQVVLMAGPSGTRIDLDGAIAELTTALAAFYDLLPAERRHG